LTAFAGANAIDAVVDVRRQVVRNPARRRSLRTSGVLDQHVVDMGDQFARGKTHLVDVERVFVNTTGTSSREVFEVSRQASAISPQRSS